MYILYVCGAGFHLQFTIIECNHGSHNNIPLHIKKTYWEHFSVCMMLSAINSRRWSRWVVYQSAAVVVFPVVMQLTFSELAFSLPASHLSLSASYSAAGIRQERNGLLSYVQVLLLGNSFSQFQNQFTRWCLCNLSPDKSTFPAMFFFWLLAKMNWMPTSFIVFHQLQKVAEKILFTGAILAKPSMSL